NAHYWLADYDGFVRWFMATVFNEPHSTKAIEDGVTWGLETTPEVLIATVDEGRCATPLADLLAAVRVPTLIVHGTEDKRRPFPLAEAIHAAIADSVLVPFEGG